MITRRPSMTLVESRGQQASDPEYQAICAARERELSEIAEQRKLEQQPLLQELATVGVNVDWVGRLLEIPSPHPCVYPILLDHITKPYSPWLSEWIGRAFARKSARPYVWDALITLLKAHALGSGAVEGVMAAISEMAQPSGLHTLIDLLSDTSLGPSRIFLVGNLMRSKRPEARSALVRNQSDHDLTVEITARLSRSLS